MALDVSVNCDGHFVHMLYFQKECFFPHQPPSIYMCVVMVLVVVLSAAVGAV